MYDKSCIILGGNGFIGKRLANYLAKQGMNVTVFDRNIDRNDFDIDVKTIKGDINNDENLEIISKSGKYIIHLLSTVSPNSSIERVVGAYNCEVSQTIKLLEMIKKTQSRIIFASSGGTVYGEQEYYPIKENSECSPQNHYAIIKLGIENILKMYNQVYDMNNLILRIANPYGPGQDYTKGVGAIDAFLKKVIHEEKIEIYGNGEARRDYIYIDDLCEAFIKAIQYEKNKVHTLNIGSGIEHSLNEIIEVIKIVTKHDSIQVKYTHSRNVDVNRSVLDVELAKSEFEFESKIDINKGIKLYYDYLIEMNK